MRRPGKGLALWKWGIRHLSEDGFLDFFTTQQNQIPYPYPSFILSIPIHYPLSISLAPPPHLAPNWANSPDVYCLDIDELLDAVMEELAAVSAHFHTAEGQPRIGFDETVEKDIARLDPPRSRAALCRSDARSANDVSRQD